MNALYRIEDVIEELIRSEIVDETDLFVDNEHLISVNEVGGARSAREGEGGMESQPAERP